MVEAARLGAIYDLLDDIAALVGAPALVEDTHHLVIAYSSHDDPGDMVRSATILGRRAAPAVVAWLTELGLTQARGPVRVPANTELGMHPRICLPLRHDEQLLGYLWFVDEDMEMSAFDLERAAESAAELVDLLRGADQLPQLARAGTVGMLLQGRVPDDPEVDRLLDARLALSGRLRVLAVQPEAGPLSAQALRQALSSLAERLVPRPPLAAVVEDVGVVVVVEPEDDSTLAEDCRSLLGPSPPVVIGLGDPVHRASSLPQAWSSARHAATCALVWPETGPVLDWPTAGLYRLVPDLAREDGPCTALLARLRAIEAEPEMAHLTRTAEVYLDLAAQAQEAAGVLTLHRTTLYQRLQRFGEVSGLDLRRGQDRTVAHLVLKAARFPTDG